MSNSTQSPKQAPVKISDSVLDSLTGALTGPTTRSALGLSPHVTRKLVTAGVLTPTNQFQKSIDPSTGQPKAGRPAPIYKLTGNGRKRVQRFAKRQGATAPAEA